MTIKRYKLYDELGDYAVPHMVLDEKGEYILFGEIEAMQARIKELESERVQIRNDAIEECATVCDEMEEHYAAYASTALINGDVQLANAASGEPRACRFIAEKLRSLKSANPQKE